MSVPRQPEISPKAGRPLFPEGYGFTPNTPHVPPAWQWVQDQIKASHCYWICTASLQGKPHAMPVWGVWFDTTLYFVTKRKSKKANNLFQNPQVVIHLESADDLVVIEGMASELTDPIRQQQVAEAYAAKYNGDLIYHD